MKRSTKEIFFKALSEANKNGLDPSPNRNDDYWVCTKSRAIFGKIIMKGCPVPKEYYLNI